MDHQCNDFKSSHKWNHKWNKQKEKLQSLTTTYGSIPNLTILQQRKPCIKLTQKPSHRPHLKVTFVGVPPLDPSDDEETKPKESHERKNYTREMLKQLLERKYKKKVSKQKYKNYLKKLLEKNVKKYNSRKYRANLDRLIDNDDLNRKGRSSYKLKLKKGDLLSTSDTSDKDTSISDDEFHNTDKLNKNKVSLRRDIGLKLQRKAKKRLYGSLDELSSDASDIDSSGIDFAIKVLPKKRNRSVLPHTYCKTDESF